jgi:hypothetical protein
VQAGARHVLPPSFPCAPQRRYNTVVARKSIAGRLDDTLWARTPLGGLMTVEFNSDEGTAIELAESGRYPQQPVPKRQSSTPRLVMLSVVAAFVSFVLSQVWAWTAQFSWSSDWWLEVIPVGIVIAGLLAFLALVMIITFRLFRWLTRGGSTVGKRRQQSTPAKPPTADA